MHSLSAWLGCDQRNTSGWASQTRKTLMNLCGPRETQKFTHWNTGMPGMEKCQFSLSIKGHKQQLHNSHVTIFFPSTTQGYTQGCVAMTTGILAGLWDLLPCTNRSKYICKHLAEGAVPTVPVPTQSPPKCAQGWNRVGTRNFCAKVQPELSVTQLNIHTRGW